MMRPIEEEIKNSYLDYAMSVIVSRAIPDVRDGLKPVQRRIIYSMYELNLNHDKPYKKSARIVGETMGKYHPHGDSAIYDALARMSQDFSLRYPLVDGQGNFGSIDGDAPAAMRYTEARLARIAEEMIRDIDKETVPFMPNFDGSLNEPVYFPSKIPQLLINGTSGIAVGMATNMLPHNLNEVCDAIKYKIDHEDSSLYDLLKFIKGPDFPGGGIIYRTKDMIDIYKTGHGKVICRGSIEAEDKRIIIKSLPYGLNKAQYIQDLANLVNNDQINNISDIKDESDRNGIRIVIKVKGHDRIDLVVNQLYEKTQLETSISVTNLVLLDNVPVVMNLEDLIKNFIGFRLDVIKKRSEYDLKKLNERMHILNGLLIALNNIDLVIKIIRSSSDVNSARSSLMKELSLTEVQANAILDMRLQRLTALEISKLKEEIDEINKKIEYLSDVVNNENTRKNVLKAELDEIKKQYGDRRRTEVIEGEISRRDEEDLIPNEESVIILSEKGLLKRVSLDEYKSQRRGGRGIITNTRDNDSVKSVVSCMAHDTLYFFTNTGRVLKEKAYRIEKRDRKALGVSGNKFLKLNDNEIIRQIIKSPENLEDLLIIVTKNGFIKKTNISEILDMRKSGIKIINLANNDEVVSVSEISGSSKIFVAASNGKAAVFLSDEVPLTSRSSRGVKSMKLNGSYVISAFPVKDDDTILSITENGLGKRTRATEFPEHHRGSSGVYLFKENEKTGKLVMALPVKDDDEIIIVTKNDQTIRIKSSDISILSRFASGVRLVGLTENDSISTACVV
ncbi:DNA gyrase subunit A [Picrophilus oshimae]|nr:DNA gyrase subunit A [Picrophilus oshimae]